ncbi:MAG: sigma-70 family RNA polymerase sigma factor [Bacteroidales bacterium]|nr:sigma-70 family RNA polymerase sigma factor [Bacteroidales bacterium]MDZ4205480.1 sigma-70 family RNA polymerase sigma factor [Bacteroidales bacterium]
MEIDPTQSKKAQKDYQLILEALHEGNQKAYAQLMDANWDAVYEMLLKMTNDSAVADDLTIEAFGKAFKNLHLYTPEFAFSSWLFKIASNNCIDHLRKKKPRHYSIDEPHEMQDGFFVERNYPCQQPDPEENIIRKQKALIMQEVIQRLKPHYRQLITLRFFKEYSYEEIAKELNLPLGTVKVQLFRAKELLYNILKHAREKI